MRPNAARADSAQASQLATVPRAYGNETRGVPRMKREKKGSIGFDVKKRADLDDTKPGTRPVRPTDDSSADTDLLMDGSTSSVYPDVGEQHRHSVHLRFHAMVFSSDGIDATLGIDYNETSRYRST